MGTPPVSGQPVAPKTIDRNPKARQANAQALAKQFGHKGPTDGKINIKVYGPIVILSSNDRTKGLGGTTHRTYINTRTGDVQHQTQENNSDAAHRGPITNSTSKATPAAISALNAFVAAGKRTQNLIRASKHGGPSDSATITRQGNGAQIDSTDGSGYRHVTKIGKDGSVHKNIWCPPQATCCENIIGKYEPMTADQRAKLVDMLKRHPAPVPAK